MKKLFAFAVAAALCLLCACGEAVPYYWRRERARLAADGTIYFLGGLGGSYTGLRSYLLDAGASELRQLSEYTRDAGRFFEGPYGGLPMEEETFNELYRKYDNPSNPMKLTFIPIEQ
jgi:hypothetical protein